MAQQRRTFTAENRAQARALFDAGIGCNQIAKALEVSAATISKWAKEEGLSFDRSRTKAATEARTVDLAAERLLLAEEMMAAARLALQEIQGPVTVHNFGGKDNTFETASLDRAPMNMRREAMTTAGIAFDKATRIVERSDTGQDQAAGVLDAIAAVAAVAAETYRESTTDED